MSKELKTGIIALLIIVLGIWGFNFLKGKNYFSPSSRYFFVEYENVNGLTEASIVTINGLKVGKVEKISFNPQPEKKGRLLVKFSMANDFEFSKNSSVKIYSASLMGGQNLAIVPNYEGALAQSKDTLKGSVELGMFDVLGSKVDPLVNKLSHVLVSADSLLLGVNQVLNPQARKSLNRTMINLESTVVDFRKTLGNVNGLLADSKVTVTATLDNTKKITDNFSVISDDLAKADLGKTVEKLQTTLTGVNALIADVNKGNGTLGKLVSDEEMYTNLTNASKELEELLREMKLNPKRFVHFSLFGKKSKPYNEETNKANVSNN